MSKKLFIGLACLITLLGGVFAYSIYKSNQDTQAWNNARQAAQNTAIQTNTILTQVQQDENSTTDKNTTPTNTAPAATSKPSSSLKTQTITDNDNTFQIDLPADWTPGRSPSSSSNAEYVNYTAQDNGNALIPSIGISVFNNMLVNQGYGESQCEGDMHSALKSDSLMGKTFQETDINIQGANKAVLETATDDIGAKLTMYVCTDTHFYIIGSQYFLSPQSAAFVAMEATLKTFKVI